MNLLRRGVVSATCADAEILAVVGDDLNGAVMSVGLKVCRLIRHGVLAAEFVLDLGERDGDIANLEGKEGMSAGRVSDAFEYFVSGALGAADVGADRVDDGLGALRHFNCLFAGDVALVIFAVAKKNDGAPDGRRFWSFHKFVAAGEVERVIEGGAASGTEFVDAVGQSFGTAGEILRHLRSNVEAYNEGDVLTWMDSLVQKFDRGFLFELESVAHRVAGIDQQTDLQGKICFSVEASNLLRRLVVVD